MAKKKIDGVIEAVHYEQDGNIKWVRAYLRRGFTFSDRVIIDRQSLVERLKAGEIFHFGKRVELMGGTFELGDPIHLNQNNGVEVITLGMSETKKDHLPAVPRI